jgi:hypothetical protein
MQMAVPSNCMTHWVEMRPGPSRCRVPETPSRPITPTSTESPFGMEVSTEASPEVRM